MARNVEIKARIENLAAVRGRLERLANRGAHTLDQTDTFFRVARGRLKLREFGDGSAELIAYERPDETGSKLCVYERVPCPAPAALHRALGRTLGIRGIVRKHREVYLVGATRIHLDTVHELGTFLELEVVLADSDTVESGGAIAAELMRVLEIPAASLVSGAYIDLLERGRGVLNPAAEHAGGQEDDRSQQREHPFHGDSHEPERQHQEPHDRPQDEREQRQGPAQDEQNQPEQ